MFESDLMKFTKNGVRNCPTFARGNKWIILTRLLTLILNGPLILDIAYETAVRITLYHSVVPREGCTEDGRILKFVVLVDDMAF